MVSKLIVDCPSYEEPFTQFIDILNELKESGSSSKEISAEFSSLLQGSKRRKTTKSNILTSLQNKGREEIPIVIVQVRELRSKIWSNIKNGIEFLRSISTQIIIGFNKQFLTEGLASTNTLSSSSEILTGITSLTIATREATPSLTALQNRFGVGSFYLLGTEDETYWSGVCQRLIALNMGWALAYSK